MVPAGTADMSRSRRVVLSALLTLVTASVAAAQNPADRVPIHIAVEHLYNTGSCKGELIVDKWLLSHRCTGTRRSTPRQMRG